MDQLAATQQAEVTRADADASDVRAAGNLAAVAAMTELERSGDLVELEANTATQA
jgi:hypothetical protein